MKWWNKFLAIRIRLWHGLLALGCLGIVLGLTLPSDCTAPEAETTPATPAVERPSEQVATEPEPQEAPDYTNWIAAELRNLNQAIRQLTAGRPGYPIWASVWDEEEKTFKRLDEEAYHVFVYLVGGPSLEMVSHVPAFALAEAITHIENAYYLTNKSRLPSEIEARDVRADEITQEVSKALTSLQLQVHYINEEKESSVESSRQSADPYINSESTIRRITEYCDEYREKLSKMITKLELILSRLPEGEIPFNSQ